MKYYNLFGEFSCQLQNDVDIWPKSGCRNIRLKRIETGSGLMQGANTSIDKSSLICSPLVGSRVTLALD